VQKVPDSILRPADFPVWHSVFEG